jgi:hypothetical protein
MNMHSVELIICQIFYVETYDICNTNPVLYGGCVLSKISVILFSSPQRMTLNASP